MQKDYPQKASIGELLSKSFMYWSKTLKYQLSFSVIYFAIFTTVIYFASAKYGIMESYLGILQRNINNLPAFTTEYKKLIATPEFQTFYYYVLGTMVFLFPLNLGFYKIYRKMDLNEKVELSDLFAGYMGSNFFRYISFFIFWIIIYMYTVPTVILAVVWVLLTLFCAPLMFFMDKTIFESISLTFKAMKLFFIEIVVCFLVAFVFKYFGMFTIIGGLFTFPFINAVIYTLYSQIFKEKN